MTSVLAIVCVRNESLHIRRCLHDLCAAGVEIILIDNDSEDDTIEKARSFLGDGLLRVERLPWRGAFSLTEQLAAKAKIVESATHDWVVHVNADEWLAAPIGFGSLAQAVSAADDTGYTCINFHEFVFVPSDGKDYACDDYALRMDTYYFFSPAYPRLMRAWKRTATLDNQASGGHLLEGASVQIFPTDFLLRHYIMLSEKHGREKYLSRSFALEDVAKGWYGNRRTITAENLRVRDSSALRRLTHPSSWAFDTSTPVRRHFWEWSASEF